jgi:hypothetical protein
VQFFIKGEIFFPLLILVCAYLGGILGERELELGFVGGCGKWVDGAREEFFFSSASERVRVERLKTWWRVCIWARWQSLRSVPMVCLSETCMVAAVGSGVV